MHIITTLESGGAERMLSNLVNCDTENEHIIVTLFQTKQHYEINKEVEIINLNLNNNILSRVKIVLLIQKVLNNIKPNIVQTWMKSNYIAPILKIFNSKIKFILNFRHGVKERYNFASKVILKHYLSIVDGYIFVSNSSFKEFEKIGFKFDNSVVITNGFLKRDYNYRSNANKELVFGYVGRFHVIKNQEFLIKEFNEFVTNQNAKLILAGRGLKYEKLAEFISDENKDKFIWKGEVKDPFRVYEDIDALILTSKSEGFPNVIGEAMSIGVPVISTNAGESYEIIGDSGFKINSIQGSLRTTLDYLVENQEELVEKSLMAYQRIQDNYLIEKKVEEYKDYYKKIIGEK
ncbi:glycosyltransferase [Staphylococcus delphini]|uniref:glycosyltransferase n=1 Tax=Staphylococcus delphini TaxID=53344 RepID=UPI0033652445